jgi:hypothetical protein
MRRIAVIGLLAVLLGCGGGAESKGHGAAATAQAPSKKVGPVLKAAAVPAPNDDFDDARPVPKLGFTDVLDTTGASRDDDDPTCGAGEGATVWYQFTPAESATLVADTRGSGYATSLSVYTGSRGALVSVACDSGLTGGQAGVRFEATAGATYFFMVGALGGGPGGKLSFSVRVAPGAPENDDFDAAIVVESLDSGFGADTTAAGRSGDDPTCAGRDAATVWYRFTATENITVLANTFGSDYDTVLSVYTGSRGALTPVACNDDAQGVQSAVRFDAVAGETYFLMVGNFSGGPGGSLSLFLGAAPPPPPNDEIADAIVIEDVRFRHDTDTRAATTAAGDPDCFGRGPTVWYRFTAVRSRAIVATTFDSDYDTTLAVFRGSSPDALSPLACNDDTGGTRSSRVRFEAIAGETYFIMVGAFASGPGGFLVFSLAPALPTAPNDDFDDATAVTVLPFVDGRDTSGASASADDPSCEATGRLGATVWYRFRATEDMTLLANTFGSDYDTVLSVHTGSPGALTPVACTDDWGLGFEAVAGETYLIMVGSYGEGRGGNLVFSLLAVP